MAIKLNEVITQRSTSQFETKFGTLSLTFRPYTAEYERTMAAAEDDVKLGALAGLLCEIILDWDVVDDAGNKVPLEVETLRKFPYDFLGEIFEHILTANRPPQKANSR